MMRFYIIFTLALSLPFSTYADLNKDLNSFFDKFEGQANVSSADIYNGQKAGYMTGGGLTIRNRVMESNLINLNLPKFDAGCGGIDIYAGGFSFLNEEQLISTMKSIASSAIGYSFLLGLETVSPQVANALKQLQTWSNHMNSLNINSCETASQLVGAAWPKDTMASQHICKSMGSGGKIFNDYLSARHKCAQQGSFDQQMEKAENDPQYKDGILEEYNIAWQSIRKHSFLKSNRELSELFMNLMGTVVTRKDGKSKVIKVITSKVSNADFLKTMLEGGVLELEGCDASKNDKCLVLSKKKITIDKKDSWIGRIRALLNAIQVKIYEDQELSASEIEMLSKSRLPLYRIVNVMSAYNKGISPIDLYKVSNIVAMDLLIQYLKEVASLVREGADQLKLNSSYSDKIDRYLLDLYRVERMIKDYEIKSSRTMAEENQMLNLIQSLEDEISKDILI